MTARKLLRGLLFLSTGAALIYFIYSQTLGLKPMVSSPSLDEVARGTLAGIESRLENHVGQLATVIGERNTSRPLQLKAAADYIRRIWESYDLTVHSQTFVSDGIEVENLWVEIPGRGESEKVLLIGAHYDTVSGTPGANDNGSGIAALLEVSALLARGTHDMTLRLVAFTNEEAPHFKTESWGSRVYLVDMLESGIRPAAMINFETLGFYSRVPGTQGYPFPLEWFYPRTGDFVAVVGNLASRRLIQNLTRAFQKSVPYPVECLASPEWLPGIDWSDHAAFWEEGIPAVMVTDTAFYRYPYYHKASDTIDKIRFSYLSEVVYGLAQAIEQLANAK